MTMGHILVLFGSPCRIYRFLSSNGGRGEGGQKLSPITVVFLPTFLSIDEVCLASNWGGSVFSALRTPLKGYFQTRVGPEGQISAKEMFPGQNSSGLVFQAVLDLFLAEFCFGFCHTVSLSVFQPRTRHSPSAANLGTEAN